MIKTLMAEGVNRDPARKIDEQIQQLGPGWNVASTALAIQSCGRSMTYKVILVVMEKPDEIKPESIQHL